MSERDSILLIEDILSSIIKIERYTEALTFNQFAATDIVIDAVVRNLEIIGEASKRIHVDVRMSAPLISWKEISAMRNKIVHEYFGIDLEIIWDIVQNDLGILKLHLLQMQKNLK